MVRAQVVQPLPDGVALRVGADQVELRAASPHSFRLHVFMPAAAAPARSIFLSDEAQPFTPFKIIKRGKAVRIKTTFGELRVDPTGLTWSLRDGSGALLGGGPLWKIAASTGSSRIRWVAAKIPVSPIRYYGSGNAPHRGGLTETESHSTLSNGSASLPQYWSTEGYGALMISASDDRPASWKSDSTGHVDWTVPGAGIDLYLAPATNLYAWLRDQAELTGFAPIPPRWALGYLQSRWGWKDKSYIDETLARFRRDQLPVDAFIFDFEWYTRIPDYTVPAAGDPTFVDFDWNPMLFPTPKAQLADFARNGLHMVGIRKPRLANAADLIMARGRGWILPSTSKESYQQRNLDFTLPAVRAWYAENNRKFDEAGVAGFWNDEGELAYSEYSYWNLAEADLLKEAKPGARFWSINRSYAPGLQRFGAATWSGDIASDWATLASTPGDLLADGLAGIPYAACDIGGFSGTPTPELLARWMEAGVFFPVMRSHSSIEQMPRFPWLYGTQAENAIREALDLRYRLLPYYDSLAYENYRNAAPLMRPLAMEFPTDDKVLDEADEWLMGGGLLAAPILAQGGSRSIYLPKDRWFVFGTAEFAGRSPDDPGDEEARRDSPLCPGGDTTPAGTGGAGHGGDDRRAFGIADLSGPPRLLQPGGGRRERHWRTKGEPSE